MWGCGGGGVSHLHLFAHNGMAFPLSSGDEIIYFSLSAGGLTLAVSKRVEILDLQKHEQQTAPIMKSEG